MSSDISIGDTRAAAPVGEEAVVAAIQSAAGSQALGPGLTHRKLVGLMLAHEQFTVPHLADLATAAARAGFGLLATSDHFQPWQANERHSGAAWVTLAALGAKAEPAWIGTTVKHFKFEPRGKRRLHKRPDVPEIEACRWWLDIERELVGPGAIVALGATAARSLCGHPVTIAKSRGKPNALADGTRVFVTIHPSLLLRLRTDAEKEAEYRHFVNDLKAASG